MNARFWIAVALTLASATGLADEPVLNFEVAAQGLSSALQQFAAQADMELLFDERSTQGKHSSPLKGRYTRRQALQRLLGGTGLRSVFTGDKSAAIKPDEHSSAPYDTTALPKIRVTAAAIPPDQDPHNTAYNRLDSTTATKTDTPIMETPVNVQVIPQQVIKDQQAVRLNQALRNVSGVNFAPNGPVQTDFVLRGFRVTQYYLDGVRVAPGFNLSPGKETANVERIEVLKGPGAVLYGRVDPGGIVNVTRKRPLATPYYALEQQFGSFDFYRTTADATGPITRDDTLLYRFNLAYENAGSFREFVNSERVFVAPVLLWNLSASTQARFYLDFQHSKPYSDFGIPALGNRPAPVPRNRNLSEPGNYFTTDDTRFGFDWKHDFNADWTLRQFFDANFTNWDGGPSINGFEFDEQTCTKSKCLISRYLNFDQNASSEQYFTGLNLTGHFDTWGLKHTMLVGGDLLKMNLLEPNYHGIFTLPPRYSIDLFHPVHLGYVPAGLLNAPTFRDRWDINQDWYGFYVQDQVNLPWNLNLLAGFRYDNAGGSTTYTSVIPGPAVPQKDSMREDAVTPRFGLLWRPIPELSLYGNYVEGFGTNNGRSADHKPLPPETAQQWEVGMKTDLWNGRLTGTLSWFNLTKQNILSPSPNPILAALGFQATTGEARNQGLEIDVSGELWEDLRLIASYAYTQSEITQDRAPVFDENGNVTGYTSGNVGHRLFGVPRHGASLWLTWEPQEGGLRGLKLGGGTLIRSQAQGDNENTFQIPGYVTLNLMAGYSMKVGPSKVSLQLNADNLLSQASFETAGFRGGSLIPGAPRSFLGSVRVEF